MGIDTSGTGLAAIRAQADEAGESITLTTADMTKLISVANKGGDVFASAMDKLGGGAKKATAEQEKLAAASKRTSDALNKDLSGQITKGTAETKKLAVEVDRVAAKSEALAAKGIGGKVFARDLAGFQAGLKLAGNSSADLTTRFEALAGAAAFAARGFALVAGGALHAAEAIRAATVASTTERENIAALGTAYAGMREGSQGTLSAEQALTEQRALSTHHIHLNAEAMAVLTRAAHDEAVVRGGTTAEAMTRYTAALAGNVEEQNRLGLTAGTAREQIAQLAAEQARHPALANTAAMDEQARTAGRQRLGRSLLESIGQGTGISAIIEGVDALTRSTDRMTEGTVRLNSVAEAQAAINTANRRAQNEAAAAMAEGENKARDAQHHVETQTKANTLAVRNYVDQLEELRKASDRAAHASTDLTSALQPGEDAAARDARQVRTILNNAGRVGADRNHEREIHRQFIATGASESAYRLGTVGPSTGGQTAAQQETALENAKRASIEIGMRLTEQGIRMEHLQAQQHETVLHYLAREHAEATLALRTRQELVQLMDHAVSGLADRSDAARRAANDAVDEDAAALGKTGDWRTNGTGRTNDRDKSEAAATQLARKNAVEAGIVANKAALESKINSHNVQMQMSAAWRNELHLNETSEQRAAQFSIGIWNSITAAAEQHFDALIEGTETGAEAVRAFAHTVGMQVAVQALKEGGFEVAKAFAAMGRSAESYGGDTGADAGVGFHLAAAAGYFALAGAGAGVAMATNVPKPATAGLIGAGNGPATAQRAGGTGEPGGNVTYKFEFAGSYIDRQGFREMTNEAISHGGRTDSLPEPMRP